MKHIFIAFFCILTCLNAKVSYNGEKKKHHYYKIPATLITHFSAFLKEDQAISSYVSSKNDLLNVFNRLVKVGYGTRFQRWVKYLWKNKSEEEHAQESIEKELLDIKKSHTVDNFIERVQDLQRVLGKILDRMESDLAYDPSLILHDDGSLTIDDEKYTLAETVFADIKQIVEKIEEQVGPRLVASAKALIMKDPITYFVGGEKIETIVQELKKVLDMPGKEVKTLLEEIFSEKSVDKKILLRLHPDRNRERQDDAETAFKNYNIVKAAFNDDRSAFDKACAAL